MRETPPAVSVITICKNAVKTIERTLESVASCGYLNLEHVIVDGGSTDGTLEILERHQNRIAKLVTEPDRGISDALNKAIALSEAEYHILVHADDVIRSRALGILVAAATKNPMAQVVCGSVVVVDKERTVRRFVPEPRKLNQKMSVPHMGSLVRKAAWAAVGGYDLRRRIAMDHLFMLRILKKFGVATFESVDEVVAQYSLGGISDRQVIQGFRELRLNLIEEGFGRFAADSAYVKLLLKSRVARLIGRS